MRRLAALAWMVWMIGGSAGGADAPQGVRLVALVGSRPITTAELAAWLRLGGVDPARATREQWRAVLDAAINRAVLIEAAESEKVKLPDGAVERAIRRRLAGPWAGEYRRETRLFGLDAGGRKRRMREQLLMERLLSMKLGTRLFVPPRQVLEWYRKHRDELAAPETRVARVITVPVPAGPDRVAAAAAARRILADLRRRALAGADFAELARKHSRDPWAEKGGLLPPIPKGASGSIFAPAVFALQKVGDVSPVVETRKGLHVLKLVEIRPPRIPLFRDVQKAIRERLLDDLRAKHVPALANDLRRRTNVRVFWMNLPGGEE